MDHNLEDSLTLEGDMETVTMDFEHSEDVVSQEDIIIEESGLEGISMQMDGMGEHATLMETSNEVVVSNFMEDSFPFHTIQHDGSSGSTISINPNQLNQLTVQNELIINQNTEQSLLKLTNTPGVSNVVTLKVAQPKPTKRAIASAPREVAIAPKPPPVQYNIAPKPTGPKPLGLKSVGSKPLGLKTMGPKPVALIANRTFLSTGKQSKSIEDLKNDTIITQVGSKIMMMPKKIKLMSSTSSEGTSGIQYAIQCPPDQAQIIGNAKGKPLMKIIQIQGQSSGSAEQSASAAAASRGQHTRYVMQQKTVPISIAGPKVIQNIKIGGNKQQIIAVKSQSPKVVSASQGSVNTNKVLISANSNPKVLFRTSAPTSTTQVFKDAGQRTQLHPINVPGKGIQYIKLVTNQPTPKATPKPVAMPSKNFVFTDKKGNVIQMRAEKVAGAKQPPPLVFAGIGPGNKGPLKTQPMTLKTERKLVRIAPVTKTSTQSTQQLVRSSHSLLAPMTTMTTTSVASKMTPIASTSSDVKEVSLEAFSEMVERSNLSNITDDYAVVESQVEEIPTEVEHEQTTDIKPTLQSLISDAVSEEGTAMNTMEHLDVEVELDKNRETIRNASFMLREDNAEHNTSNTSEPTKEQLISTSQANDSMYSNESQADYSVNTSYVLREDGTFERDSSDISGSNKQSVFIVPGAPENDSTYSDDSPVAAEGRKTRYISIEAECDPYALSSDSPPAYSEEVELGMRPRKPCNCTKSQCLKLYCDCFANGEFCNKCNCNNCHNNLENEDVRQKSIRSCLERNPNAFRPKIGKSRGGLEIIRRHTKGCNCKRSGCLKKYCECYEAKIACTAMCKCVGCRNIEATLVRRRDATRLREKLNDSNYRPASTPGPAKQPCSFMTTEVIEAVCQCLIAAAGGGEDCGGLLRDMDSQETDPVQDVIEEFARCLQDVISASHHQL